MKVFWVFALLSMPLLAQPDSFNAEFQWITNVEGGPDLALNASDENVFMSDKGNFTNQLWRLVPMGSSFQISTAIYGEEQPYEPREIDGNWRLLRVDAGFFTGAFWDLSAVNSEEFTLATQWLGPDMVLTMIDDGNGGQTVTMAENTGAANQRWRFEQAYALELIPTLTPPHFINADNIWVESPWNVGLRLPNPNSDGIAADSNDDLFYMLEIINTANGDILFEEAEIRSETWPITRFFSLTENNFEIRIKRSARGVRDQDSKAVIIDGFSARGGDPEFPILAAGYDRWLPHIPRTAGGFSARLEFYNKTDHPTLVRLSPRNADGAPLEPVTLPIFGGDRVRWDVYGENGLFPDPDILDQISHIGITENSRNVEISILTTADITGYGVWSRAIDLRAEGVSGSRLELSGTTPNPNYYLGVAVLNLHSIEPFDVFIDQVDTTNGAIAETIFLHRFQMGEKRLALPSLAFSTFIPNANYIIRNDGNYPMQAFGLTGSLDGSFIGETRITALEEVPTVVKGKQSTTQEQAKTSPQLNLPTVPLGSQKKLDVPIMKPRPQKNHK